MSTLWVPLPDVPEKRRNPFPGCVFVWLPPAGVPRRTWCGRRAYTDDGTFSDATHAALVGAGAREKTNDLPTICKNCSAAIKKALEALEAPENNEAF